MKIEQAHTAFSRKTVVELTDQGIVHRRGDKLIKRINYRDIKSIQLVCDGHTPAHDKVVYKCKVVSRSGTLIFSNALFRGRDKAKMDTDYQRIVRALHKRVRECNPDVKLIEGSNFYLSCAWFCLFAGGLLMLMLPALMLFGDDQIRSRMWTKGWVFAALPMMLGGFAWPTIKRGGAKRYTFEALPVHYLPAA